MSEQNNGGPAFPHPDYLVSGWEGMTLRDYFAAKAIEGFNKKMVDYGWDDEVLEAHAREAYRIADAMLKARQG